VLTGRVHDPAVDVVSDVSTSLTFLRCHPSLCRTATFHTRLVSSRWSVQLVATESALATILTELFGSEGETAPGETIRLSRPPCSLSGLISLTRIRDLGPLAALFGSCLCKSTTSVTLPTDVRHLLWSLRYEGRKRSHTSVLPTLIRSEQSVCEKPTLHIVAVSMNDMEVLHLVKATERRGNVVVNRPPQFQFRERATTRMFTQFLHEAHSTVSPRHRIRDKYSSTFLHRFFHFYNSSTSTRPPGGQSVGWYRKEASLCGSFSC